MSHTVYFDVAASRFATDRATGEQPRVIRLAWWDDRETDPVCHLIKPVPGMTIDPKTLPYHGLSLDVLERDGAGPLWAVAMLEQAASGARSIVSFNSDFHWRNLYRLMGIEGATPPDHAACAMKIAAPAVGIPAMRPGGGWKSPSLREACEFFGAPGLPSADDPVGFALSTVRAVRAVYEACTVEA